MRKYPVVTCACGRRLGSNVFRQHARKCLEQLRAWRRAGNNVAVLDERSRDRRGREGDP